MDSYVNTTVLSMANDDPICIFYLYYKCTSMPYKRDNYIPFQSKNMETRL